MEHRSLEFFQEVREIAKNNRINVGEEIVENDGKPSAIIKLSIDVAGVDIIVTGTRCKVVDSGSETKQFDKSVEGWRNEALAYIEALIKKKKDL